MRHLSLSAVGLVLVLCGGAFAQQRLVRHNDQNDSCRRFKMRILIPADVDHELPVKQFAGGVDSKMVWNPCEKETTQIAIAPTIPPLKNDTLFAVPAAGPADRRALNERVLSKVDWFGAEFASGPGAAAGAA